MDQKSLYELQTGSGELIQADYNAALIGRDQFITDDISGKINVAQRINAAELSIGDGRLTRSLLQCVPNMQLDCIDISPARINYVRRMLERDSNVGQGYVRFTECNFDTQFGVIDSDFYDFVIAMDIMEHVFDVFNFIENCQRILRTGGRLYIRVPNIAYIKHRIRLLLGKLPVTASWFGSPEELTSWRLRHGWDGGHLHLFTIPILYELLETSGLQPEVCRDPGVRFSKFRDMAPNLLYSNPLIVARKI